MVIVASYFQLLLSYRGYLCDLWELHEIATILKQLPVVFSSENDLPIIEF